MSRYIRPKVEWCEAILVPHLARYPGQRLGRQGDRTRQGAQPGHHRGLPSWLRGLSSSDELADYAHAVVTYDEQQILGALDGAINTISDGAGNTRSSMVVRHNC